MNVVVADSKLHADTLIGWLGLDPDQWVGNAYGKRLNGVYAKVILVRPLAGVSEEHTDWILGHLIPRVTEKAGVSTLPMAWLPGVEAEFDPITPEDFEPLSIFAT